jgi:hypothetical protein
MFNITSVCRADIVQAFSDVDALNEEISDRINKMEDDEMQYLASKMADDYCNQLYWESLRVIFVDRFMEEKRSGLNGNV